MVTCKLMGGLCNQLFQIAATHALALRNNDISVFDLNNCYTPNQGYTSIKYKDSIFSKINNVDLGSDFINRMMYDELNKIYNEPNFSYTNIDYIEGMCLVGYFQSEKYFIDFKEEIINLFTISDEDKIKIKKFFSWYRLLDKPITSVHIRRGDYLKHPNFHPVCSVEYFNKAIKEIGDSYFVFVSDDMNWVKKTFNGNNNYVYSEFNDEILDLTLMVLCDNNIISNSSFSWWGAYLNPNTDKKIIAPKKWFGIEGPKDTQDLIPSNWITIDA